MKTFVALFLFSILSVLQLQDAEGGVLINEILADPPAGLLGDANRDGVRSAFDDEFVELVNTDFLPVSLEGWTLSDATATRHIFSSSSLIAPNDFFVVFGGGDPFGFENIATASTGSLSLNNAGDTVYLRDAMRTLIDSFTYGSEGGQDVSLSRVPDALGPFSRHTSVSALLFSPERTVHGEEQLPHPDQNPVPEPTSFLLFGAGLLGLVRIKWRPFVAALFLTLSCSNPAFGEGRWEEVTGGIPESHFRTIAASPLHSEQVFVGSSKSLYKTTDGGKSWKKVLAVHGTQKAVHQILPVGPAEVWAATDNGLYHSSDSGESWEKRFSGLGNKGRKVLSLVTTQTEEGESVFIGTEEGLFQSSDGGKRWERGGAELSNAEVSFLVMDPQEKVLYAAALAGVYHSKDFGQTWERIFITSVQGEESGDERNGEGNGDLEENPDSVEKVTSIVIEENGSKKILLGTRNGIYQSEDKGRNWTKLNVAGLGDPDVNHLILHQGRLYAATQEGVFVFEEERGSWNGSSTGLTKGRVVYLSRSANEGALWAASTEGLFKWDERMPVSEDWQREAKEILHHFEGEPSIEEIQEAAIRYAEVHPEKIIAWRKAAARKAYLPTVSTGMDVDIDRNIAVDTGGTTNPDFFIVGPDERGFNWDINVRWDLGDLIWNDDQTSIDVRSRLMVQLRDDVLDEVTRLYFERRRLQIALLMGPPKEMREKIEKELRLQELTANIDALTGGYLTRALKQGRMT